MKSDPWNHRWHPWNLSHWSASTFLLILLLLLLPLLLLCNSIKDPLVDCLVGLPGDAVFDAVHYINISCAAAFLAFPTVLRTLPSDFDCNIKFLMLGCPNQLISAYENFVLNLKIFSKFWAGNFAYFNFQKGLLDHDTTFIQVVFFLSFPALAAKSIVTKKTKIPGQGGKLHCIFFSLHRIKTNFCCK